MQTTRVPSARILHPDVKFIQSDYTVSVYDSIILVDATADTTVTLTNSTLSD